MIFTKPDRGDLAQLRVTYPRLRFQHSPQKSSRQCARESVVSPASVQRILKKGNPRVYVTRLVEQLIDGDPDRRLQFYE